MGLITRLSRAQAYPEIYHSDIPTNLTRIHVLPMGVCHFLQYPVPGGNWRIAMRTGQGIPQYQANFSSRCLFITGYTTHSDQPYLCPDIAVVAWILSEVGRGVEYEHLPVQLHR